MKKGDIICPECHAGFRRIELNSRQGRAGEYRCPVCDHLLEVSDWDFIVSANLRSMFLVLKFSDLGLDMRTSTLRT